MDGHQFDLMTRRLSSETSRRQTLAGAVGGALALLGVLPEAGSAGARCRPRCGKCARCKNGKCKRKPNGTPCGGGRECRRGTCACPAGEQRCRGACFAACEATELRNPETCGCCLRNGARCSLTNTGACCSGGCFNIGNDTTICRGRAGGQACTFDGDCDSNECVDGVCADRG